MFRRRPAPTTLSMLKKAVFDGFDYALAFPYIEGLSKVLISLKGKCFRQNGHPLHNSWRFPKAVIHADVGEFFRSIRAAVANSFEETLETFTRKLDSARETPARAAFVSSLQLRLAPMGDHNVLARGDYHPGLVAVYKRMGGIYIGPSRSWRIRCSPETLRSNLIDALGLTEDQIEILEGQHELLEDGSLAQAREWQTIAVGGVMPESTGESDAEATENEVYLASVPEIQRIPWGKGELSKVMDGYQLYDYQRVGVTHLVQRSSALLADDMGLGKTRQSIVAAHIQAKDKPIMIICLASLVINWKREILLVQPDAKVSVQEYNPSAQWVIVNYERLGRFVPMASRFAVMVIDEAHRLKEPTAEWTRHAFDIASQVPNRYLLTGTPVLNRESELHTLLRLSGHPIGQMPLKAFCDEFAGSSEFRSVLRERLSDWMLRRNKDVLTQLKGKQRQTIAVSLSDAERTEYQDVLRSDKTPLARIGTLRAMIERFKARVSLDMVRELDAEDKVIIFCEFIDTVNLLKAELDQLGIGNVTLTGALSRTQRQKAVDRFQDDDSIRVFIGTTSAAGTGINLTAANYVIFTSLPWTPGLQDQAEDRAYRNGQLRMVVVKIPLVEESIDQGLWAMLTAKRLVARELIEPGDAEEKAKQELAAVLLKAA